MKSNVTSEIVSISAEQTWPLRHRMLWPDENPESIKLSEDHNGIHFGLKKNGQLISVISIFIKRDEAQFRKFATEVNEQNQGHGTKLLTYIIDFLSGMKIKRIWCNARKDKIDFYRRFGMEPTDQEFSKGGIFYVRMEKKIPDQSYL
jgi:predicted GNAT family N-acyltransferase